MSDDQDFKNDGGRPGMSEAGNIDDLKKMAENLVSFGKAAGADEVEVTIADGREFGVDVRLGNIENLVEAGSRHLSLRVLKNMKTAYATSSDLGIETLRRLLRSAVSRAELGSRDEFAGLPPLQATEIDIPSLELFDPEIGGLDPRRKIDLALETERIALADERITNSHGASFVTNEVTNVLANSKGFSGAYEQTFCSLSVGLQAGETDEKAEDYWSSADRFFKRLEPPEAVAKKAVERTVRQLHPRKIETQTVPVIFEPDMTAWLVGFLFACVSGVAVYQRASCLAEKLGEWIGNEKITVVDDGLMPGKLGSRPFDTEGMPCRKTTVVENGLLRRFLCHTYAGRKLKLEPTGNADRTAVGPNNFYLLPSSLSQDEIIRSTQKGLLLTRTIGHGLNPVTGDISRGAFGLWIEKGEVAYPVSEITIAGNLEDILKCVEMVGNDLDFRSPVCGPTIKVAELAVAGE
jgi:PmbA protein